MDGVALSSGHMTTRGLQNRTHRCRYRTVSDMSEIAREHLIWFRTV